jgi:hypothetical protein
MKNKGMLYAVCISVLGLCACMQGYVDGKPAWQGKPQPSVPSVGGGASSLDPYVVDNPTEKNLMVKFGTTTVSDTFTAIHVLLQEHPKGFYNSIKVGDYLDLPSLNIEEYNPLGEAANTNPKLGSTRFAPGANGSGTIFNTHLGVEPLVDKGIWNASTSYAVGDWVRGAGRDLSYYVAKTANTNSLPPSAAWQPKSQYHGTLLRLVVVGINTYRHNNVYRLDLSQNENITRQEKREALDYNDATPHIVFQFMNIPVQRRYEATPTCDNGYLGSEMRAYLVPVEGKAGSGKFTEALVNAGVPLDNDAIAWAPKRYVGMQGNGPVSYIVQGINVSGGNYYAGSAVHLIQDKLWLPTEFEILGDTRFAVQHYKVLIDDLFTTELRPGPFTEYPLNQGVLSYYQSNSRAKYWYGNLGTDNDAYARYWTASPVNQDGFYNVHFVALVGENSAPAGATNYRSATCGPFVRYYYNDTPSELHPVGVAPAFCIQ